MTKQALDGNMLAEVGREFFSGARSDEETCSFLTALLERCEYENLATVMSSGCIDKNVAASYLHGGGNRRVSDRYFAVFIELVEKSGVDMELVWPMFFAAFDAPKDGYLYSFVGGIDAYFKRYAYANYDAAVDVVRRFDHKYKCLSTLMEVDRARTLDIVLDVLIYGKSANKTALRKYLMEKRIDIVPALCNEYIRSGVKAKEGIVRLLLLYKGDPRADRFLGEIDKSEKSLVIKKLIDKDRGRRAGTSGGFEGEAAKDGGISSVVKVNGSDYTVSLTKELSVEVKPLPYPKAVRIEEEKLRKRLKKVCRECELAMSENTRWGSELFLKRLANDEMFAAVATTLLFSAYNNGTLSDIIIIENGEIRDLDNKKRVLTESEVAVSHPCEWEKFDFLHRLDVTQPFEQVGREVFVPTDAEKSYNSCGRLKGRVMPVGDFKESLVRHGYKLLNKNRYSESNCAGRLRGDVMCVLEFDATNFAEPDRLIAMGNVRFYRYADLIKLGGQIYTDGVKPCSVQSLSAVLFSEFLRDVFDVIKPVS